MLDGIPVTKKSTRFRLRKKKSGGGSWGGTIAGWGLDMNQCTGQSANKTSVDATDSSGFVSENNKYNDKFIFQVNNFFMIIANWNNCPEFVQ